MSTWEERMAEKAAARALVREAEGVAGRAVEDAERERAAGPHEEAYIEQFMASFAESGADPEFPICACIGPPPNCVRCYCRLRSEALDRLRSQT